MRRLFRVEKHLLVLACVAAVLVFQVCTASRKAPPLDDAMINHAASLLNYGVLAGAFVPNAAVPAPGRQIAPGFPAIIAAVAALDSRLAECIHCIFTSQVDCFRGNALRSILVLQTLAGLAALAIACFLARELSGSAEVAGLTTLLMFVMGRFAEFAVQLAPYLIVTALALAFCALLVIANRRRSMSAAVLGGLVLGVLSLIEVYYVALVVLVPVLLVAAERLEAKPDQRFAHRAAAAFVVATGLALAPWMVRNYALFGDVALTEGIAAKLLADRVTYNILSFGDLLAGMFCWMPGIGDLAKSVLPAETTRKFELYYEGGLLWEGARILAATEAAGGRDGSFGRLVQAYVLGDPLNYAAATVLLGLRGLRSTGGLLVLWGLLALPLLVRRLCARHDFGPFLLVGGPLVGLVAVQALLTSNLPCMNVALLFVYAYAIAEVTGGLELPLGLLRLLSRHRIGVVGSARHEPAQVHPSYGREGPNPRVSDRTPQRSPHPCVEGQRRYPVEFGANSRAIHPQLLK